MDNALQLMKDRSEFNTVARLMKKQQDGTLGKQTQEGDELGDLHLGDTTINQSSSSGIPALLLSAVLGAAGAGGAAWWLSQPSTPPAQTPEFNQQDYVIKPGVPEGWQPD